MSRKDPRAVLIVPLAKGWRRALRLRTKRGSLGDAARRMVEAGIDGAHDGPPIAPHSMLTVQLPRKTLSQVNRLALAWGRPPAHVVAQILRAGLEVGRSLDSSGGNERSASTETEQVMGAIEVTGERDVT